MNDRYDLVRALLDEYFGAFNRRARELELGLERMELWHDLLEAALLADRELVAMDAGTADDRWREAVLLVVEARFRRYCG